jgi:hypothetical protein
MTKDEISAITLMMLEIWMHPCTCSFYAHHEGRCSKCTSTEMASKAFPLIHQAFQNTIENMEKQK